ncbi:NUDIX domain-containing protein [Alloalcanivorax profundimaris]|jgi:ADP-ribose pyrophosphatase|uniref:ADP-ribose pyrophosphatase n=1 Tax=Alloalcanivorax profundimaris TaxID=2735259 RepID=A0ABS0AU39_9GAMM|nr:NUDIX domain-containing protein [Alloalcanivorax profundimaris]MAO60419.1 ADP-ribose diphosphatase [Alcanivorax sp.]MBM1144298.1 NUDIX domain-containing protein [Alcanivorax sp. ZXX171]MCQ6260789.1 NUDIX domain-containing protein [Alcanivorax sp. MM125-6]UWN50668.1 ADP-ribose pyrophosphatase [Alcanivorax sp. ALC70]MBF1802447.1 NUDIX domain-containing protein [Alloalcanivorax profundimaris]|tara:strand:- start:95709 stop:96335 length:627 start_codon:yes stop_codon:yes gene_type:complete
MNDPKPVFTAEDVEILERETPFQGFFRVERLTLRHRHYQGGWGAPVKRELFVRPPAAAVLPYDPVRGEILLVEQFRVGALEWRDTPWCLELVAGLADKDGEPVADLVRREALEEAGVEIGAMRRVAHYMPSPGGSNERLQVFVGQADLSGAGGIHGVADEGEDIRVVVQPVSAIESLLQSGRVDNAASLITLQWLLLNREALDREWRP